MSDTTDLRQLLLLIILALFSWVVVPRGVAAQRLLTGQAGLELRGFASEPEFDGQANHAASAFFRPELFLELAGGSQRIVVSPFLRLDANDARRSHVDLREAYWQYLGRSLELRAGFARVFWGVTESRHLVDIINQTDGIEGPDGEEKLGQPMIQTTWLAEFGTVEVFIMPFFRERTFPGQSGRLRTPTRIGFDNSLKQERIDLALRFTKYLGNIDLGVSTFYGTSRDPLLSVDPATGFFETLYPTIGQIGLDVQWTVGPLLGKLETIYRTGYGDDFVALVSGIEYTISDVKHSGIDLGLLAEYHRDGRDDLFIESQRFKTTPFNDDIFGGFRIALNDVQSSSVLAGTVVDRISGETAVFLEASRRVGSRMTAQLEVRTFQNTESISPLYFFRNDDYAQLQLTYYF